MVLCENERRTLSSFIIVSLCSFRPRCIILPWLSNSNIVSSPRPPPFFFLRPFFAYTSAVDLKIMDTLYTLCNSSCPSTVLPPTIIAFSFWNWIWLRRVLSFHPHPPPFFYPSFFIENLHSRFSSSDMNRRLSRRPSLEDLQQKNILPGKLIYSEARNAFNLEEKVPCY